MMNLCPICQSPINKYRSDDGGWQYICWNCGHYESDSQAYKEHPELFENMVRENPTYFFEKFLINSSDDSYHEGSNRRQVTRTLKRASRATDQHFSRCQPKLVPRIQRNLTNIPLPRQQHRQPLQTNRPPSVRRHSIIKRLQMMLK